MLSQVLDHLWQSTLMALFVALLVLAFRKAAAGVRYALWLAASLKFLVPFAALAALGRLLAPAGLFPSRAAPEAALIEQAARPLAQFPFAHGAALQAPLAPVQAAHGPLPQGLAPAPLAHLDLVPVILAVWALGSAVVLAAWAVRWAKVRKVARSATPLAWSAPMPVLASPSLMEPGLIGLLRPVLVVPQTLPERLTRSEIDAIVAHEACHLRRRDNLTAVMHMVVEALFWFHPMVWWIGARLIDERERACDEAVVAGGHDRAAYARSLVESSRLYLQSPLSCVAGASGSDLKSRVAAIMTAPLASPLAPLKKALLLAAGACAFATPVAAGLLASPDGKTVMSRAATIASAALRAPLPAAVTEQPPAEKPVVLARNEQMLAPGLAVSRRVAPETFLAVSSVQAPVYRPASLTAVAPTPLPAAVSPVAPPKPAPPPAAPPPSSAEAKKQAEAFVKGYADSTLFRTIGRWAGQLCIRVVGLTEDQGEAVKRRVEEVATSVGVPAKADCERTNLQIGFTEDPQGMLDGVKGQRTNFLGDMSSRTRGVKTVTLPIQAWYVTNGSLYSARDPDPMKVPVLYQYDAARADTEAFHAGLQGQQVTGDNGASGGWGTNYPTTPGVAGPTTPRTFLNVFVIVDLRKTGGKPLGVISDYVAMLALSEPRALGQCNALPSISDLFAGCAGRPAPDALTAADAAYLTALYDAQLVRGAGGQGKVIERMADILANPGLALNDGTAARAALSSNGCDDPRVVVTGSRIARRSCGAASPKF